MKLSALETNSLSPPPLSHTSLISSQLSPSFCSVVKLPHFTNLLNYNLVERLEVQDVGVEILVQQGARAALPFQLPIALPYGS